MIVLVKTINSYNSYEFSKKKELAVLSLEGKCFSGMSMVEIALLHLIFPSYSQLNFIE